MEERTSKETVEEREKKHTLVEMTGCILLESHLPHQFLGEVHWEIPYHQNLFIK